MKKILKKLSYLIPDKLYLSIIYYYVFQKKINWKNPSTYNEKLQWLKLYDRNPLYTILVDKYAGKEYIRELIGDEYIIPTIGVYDNVDDIDINKLPDAFVLKTTHDSGGVRICIDKNQFDFEEAKKYLNIRMKQNYYYIWREWPYKNVKPRIIVEKYMIDEACNELRDYKFFCFNGKAKFFKVDFDRFTNHHANYYDINCKLLPFGEESYPPQFDKEIEFPKSLDIMIEFSEKIAADMKFLRVDFYEVNGKLYFGELTFYPAAGFGKFIPEGTDLEIGKLLKIK